MKKLALPLLAVAVALAAGYTLRTMNADLTGKAIGTGDARIEVYRARADSHWAANGFTGGAAWGSVRFPQIVTDNDPAIASVRLTGSQVRKQRTDNQRGLVDTIDIFTLNGDPMSLGGGLVGETGSLEGVAIPTYDTRVSIGFTQTYTNPVVFVQVAHHFGGHPIMAYADDVTPDGATIVITEPQNFDGYHVGERIHYMVLEAGSYTLDDGSTLQVGTVGAPNDSRRGWSKAKEVVLDTPTDGEPIVITGIQRLTIPGFADTRIRKTSDGSDRYTGFEVRIAHEDDTSETRGPALGFTIGYLSYGAPFVEGPGKIVLRDARGTWAGYDYARRPRGACINLEGTAAYGLSTGHFTAAPSNSKVSLIRYYEPDCVGYGREGGYTDRDVVSDITGPGDLPSKSIRIMWQSKAETTERRTWTEDEIIIQDEFNTFMVRDGDLKHYRTLPATGLLYEAWSTTYGDIAEARFNANGSFSLHRSNGFKRWGTRSYANVDRLVINRQCSLYLNQSNNNRFRDYIGGSCDLEDMPTAPAPAMPGLKVVFYDLDRDGHPELILDLQNPDGTGHFIDTPLSIARLSKLYGYGIPVNLWNLLSPTQKALLVEQMPERYGDTIEDEEVDETLTALEHDGVTLPSTSVAYTSRTDGLHMSGGGAVVVEGPTYVLVGGEAVRVPATTTTVTAGDVQYMFEFDQYGPGYELGATVARIDFTVGGVATVSFVGPSAAAAVNLDAGGLTAGIQASVVGVAFAVGDTDGSYVGFSADVGVGFWGDVAWGRNDQYGFAAQVPGIPVGVAIYVHHDDVMMSYDFAEGWTMQGYETVSELGAAGWGYTRDWVLANGGDVVVKVDNTWDDTRVTLVRTTQDGVQIATMVAGSTSQAVTTTIDEVADLADALDAVGGALADGGQAISNTLDDWANGVGDFAEGVGDDLLSGAKNIYKKVKFW